MNARTRNARRRSLMPWLAAGAVVLLLGLANPVGATFAADSSASSLSEGQAVVKPSPEPEPKPGNNGPVVDQPADPCAGSVARPNCNPRPQKEPTATPTPTTKPKEPPTNTPTPTPKPKEPTNTPTPAPPTDTPVPPTNTPEPPTSTPVPPTNTPQPEPPTATPVPPTSTPEPELPTATPVPPTNTPVPPPPTKTPIPPTAPSTPVPEPEIVPEEPTAEPTAEATATPEPPTSTPELPTATPVPPTATSTPTSTSTPIVAAVASEPPATPAPPTATPVPPTPIIDAVTSPLSDPNPLILLGTLLFALAAAAGQALRSDPTMIRRLIHGFDGVRRSGGTPARGGAPKPTYATDPPTDAPAHPTDRFETVSDHGAEAISSDAYPTNPGFSRPDGVLSQGNGLAQGAHGIGGQAGGADHLAKGAHGGLHNLANGNADLLAKGMPNGLEGANVGGGHPVAGHDVAANAGGHGPGLQADALGPGGAQPADLSVNGPADPRISGGLSGSQIGGGQGGDLFARGAAGPGHELANGLSPSVHQPAASLNVSGHEIAQGSGFAPDHGTLSAGQGAGSQIGGGHGAVGGDLFAKAPAAPPDVAGMGSGSGASDIAFGGTAAAEADLADRLDALARSVSSGAVTPPVDGGVIAAGDGATMAASAFDPAWLSAGALARSAHQEPLPPMFRCPACRKPLAYGHRFCGYCGEPLDKTLA